MPRRRVAIAGVAWAPDRGVPEVEVAIDGEWRECTLSRPISNATWVQWTYAWDAAGAGPGDHTIAVRATDGDGEVQTDRSHADPTRTARAATTRSGSASPSGRLRPDAPAATDTG